MKGELICDVKRSLEDQSIIDEAGNRVAKDNRVSKGFTKINYLTTHKIYITMLVSWGISAAGTRA